MNEVLKMYVVGIGILLRVMVFLLIFNILTIPVNWLVLFIPVPPDY
jgi:hypothetical protein